jgi:diaminopimelate decarboxylase
MYLHGTSQINDKGHLQIGGCDTTELVQRFGTPLYLMDEALIRQRCREYVEAFQHFQSVALQTLDFARVIG